MARVLIIGYGKMGRIHAKHLSELSVPWDFHDPCVPGGVSLDRLADYTHAIIATPIATYYDVYRRLDAFSGRILIEKPVVVRAEHLHLLDDMRVFAGMCERFNPVVEALMSRIRPVEIVSLEFCRTSLTGDVADVGIHDLDLFCHLQEMREVPAWRRSGNTLVAKANAAEGCVCSPTTVERKRTITVNTARQSTTLDLLSQQFGRRQLPFAWPVRRELQALLEGERTQASFSHVWLGKIV